MKPTGFDRAAIQVGSSRLGERLSIGRQQHGLTQEDVANQVQGLTAAALSNYERGVREPDTGVVARLAALYKVSTDWLLGRTDDPRPARSQAAESSPLPDWLRNLPPDMQKFVEEESKHGWPYPRLARGLKMQDLTKEEFMAIVDTWMDAKKRYEKEFGPGK